MYKEYKYVVDKVKELYQDKGKFKNSYKNLLKDINKVYGKVFKLNKKIDSKLFNSDEKRSLLEIELNGVLDELRDKDSNLCIEKVNEVISMLNNNTSYYDILNLIGYNYVYFRNISLLGDSELGYNDIVERQVRLEKFLCNNHFSFLDNVKILDSVNIPQVIEDRYKLLNINISQDEIDNNTDNYMDIIDKIRVIDAIVKSDVSYEELLFQVNIGDIIKK